MNIWNRLHRSRWKLSLLIFISLLSTLYVTQKRTYQVVVSILNNDKSIKSNEVLVDVTPQLLYACPSKIQTNRTNQFENHLLYETESVRITNVTSYLESFRQIEYDHWGHTYEEVKRAMYAWKSQYYKDIKPNSIIYESACGIGMNLYMTLEILQQVTGVTNITIYGNDYKSQSVYMTRHIFNQTALVPSSFGHLGSICESDSTQLDFVPTNMFDLVFTGYISPLVDPLLLNQTTNDENYVQYTAYCEHGLGSSLSNEAARAQQRQNDWYGKWVGEMIRIAKPGAPIIIEQVSYPLCDAIFDWGGVAPSFWKDAIKTYNWDVNRSSLEMKPDSLFRKRYHVHMRKKVLRSKNHKDS